MKYWNNTVLLGVSDTTLIENVESQLVGQSERSGTGMPIVIVEDDEVDVEALTRALRRAKLTNPIFVAHDGDAALDILEDQESQPCAVVVDLHMPRVGGLEFLEKLRSHDNDKLSQNIVFLLTAMKRDLERMQASQLGANGYFLKSDLGQIAREISVHCQTGKCAA